ncbi:alpha/beta hydrolase [Aestuariivivens insulae]|uniref:alpha/beta hydrolase n=1 Tax=Aestuariivivens insulae TaxID=1621988 RepID=UPI001F5809E5|nr:alpha/beta hydrolase-fold protein [Aestuariivivens insulae]
MKPLGIVAFIITVFFSCKKEKNTDSENPILGNEEVTFIIKDLPEDHDFSSDIYLSGDFEGWSGGREQFKLKKESKQYRITIPKYREFINFKFTNGSWETVECQLDGNPIENRSYTFTNKNETVAINISNWNSKAQDERPSTALNNVHVFDEAFAMPQLKRTRKVSVYLPPNYETSNLSYPVLYMQDGQNVFDLKTSFSGEWEVDETLNKLYNENHFSLIVVAIDHGGDTRLSEYSPWDNVKYGKGEGEAYVDFLVSTLKPAIDKAYRTKPDREDTAIMGSSMGGLISHYAFFKYPDFFGKAAVFSPSFWYAEDCFEFTKQHANLSDSKVYYLVGGKEGEDTIENVRKMELLLSMNNFPEYHLDIEIIEAGMHNESFWKAEFKKAIEWLFNRKEFLEAMPLGVR